MKENYASAAAENTLAAGKASDNSKASASGNSTSAFYAGTKHQSLVEHGAVAAVIPAPSQSAAHRQSNRTNSLTTQKFLPTIGASTNQPSNQALYAATS